MTTVAENVLVAVTGSINAADLGTTLPESAAGSIDAAFDELGYAGEAGITESQGTTTTKIKAWQNSDVVRTVQTEHSLTFKFPLIETNETTLEVFHGNYDAGVVLVTSQQPGHKSWVLEVVDGDNDIRIVIPDGQVIERGDIVYNGSDAITYEVTIECYPDADGVKAYKYLDTAGASS